MPNELIISIFKMVLSGSIRSPSECREQWYRDADGSGGPENTLAHVCQHFRAIVLSVPQFWRHVSNLQERDQLDAYLRRSGDSGLVVILDVEDNSEDNHSDFLEVVIAHSHRWERFDFVTVEIVYDCSDLFAELSSICHGLILPMLKTMSLQYPSVPEDGDELEYWEGDPDPEDVSDYHFYRTWSTPCLQELITEELVPTNMEGVNLESLDIVLSPTTRIPKTMYRISSSPIPSLQALRSLSLNVDIQSPFCLLGDGKISLPMLETLVWLDPDVQHYSGKSALYVPNVSVMTLEVPSLHNTDIGEWFNHFLHKDNDFLLLRKLFLIFSPLWFRARESVLRMDQILLRFPGLEVLDIDQFYGSLDVSPSGFIPQLQEITMRLCPQLDANFLRMLAERLKSGDKWPHFK